MGTVNPVQNIDFKWVADHEGHVYAGPYAYDGASVTEAPDSHAFGAWGLLLGFEEGSNKTQYVTYDGGLLNTCRGDDPLLPLTDGTFLAEGCYNSIWHRTWSDYQLWHGDTEFFLAASDKLIVLRDGTDPFATALVSRDYEGKLISAVPATEAWVKGDNRGAIRTDGVYVTSCYKATHLCAVDPNTWNVLWDEPLPPDLEVQVVGLMEDDSAIVYAVHPSNGYLHAILKFSHEGQLLWSTEMGDGSGSFGFTIGSNGLIYTVAGAVDGQTGERLWKHPEYFSTPIILPDGRLVFHTWAESGKENPIKYYLVVMK